MFILGIEQFNIIEKKGLLVALNKVKLLMIGCSLDFLSSKFTKNFLFGPILIIIRIINVNVIKNSFLLNIILFKFILIYLIFLFNFLSKLFKIVFL